MAVISTVPLRVLGCHPSTAFDRNIGFCGSHGNEALLRGVSLTCRSQRQSQLLKLPKVVSASHGEEDCGASASSGQATYGRRAAGLFLGGLVASVGIGGESSDVALAGGADEVKRKNVPIEEIKSIIAADIGERHYFITGELTTDIFSENCRFKDPTNDTTGLRKYLDVVSILFDPAASTHELLSIEINSPNTILAKWRLGGYLQFPWRPRVVPFEGSTLYTVGDEGLIVSHEEKWSISPITALIETITPSWVPSLL